MTVDRVASMTTPELSIVLPVYNEGEAVEPVLRALSSGVSTPHELVVVYDFDEDTTVPVVERLAPEIPGLRGLRNDLGRGVLNAMKAGIAGTSAPFVLISMADGSDEPSVVDPMVALARDGADVVAASRYMRGGHQVGGPPLKRLMSRVAGLTLHWFAGVPTHDPTNNFKLYSRRYLDSVEIESTAGFELALELTVKATIARRRIAEVPTTWRDRTSGQSNFKLRKWLPHYLHWYSAAFRGPSPRRPAWRTWGSPEATPRIAEVGADPAARTAVARVVGSRGRDHRLGGWTASRLRREFLLANPAFGLDYRWHVRGRPAPARHGRRRTCRGSSLVRTRSARRRSCIRPTAFLPVRPVHLAAGRPLVGHPDRHHGVRVCGGIGRPSGPGR